MVKLAVANQVDRSEWNERLMTMPFYSIFQLHEWGEFKSRFGWKPLYVFDDSSKNSPQLMAQLLFKQYPLKTTLAWIPGGPLLQNNQSKHVIELLSKFKEALQKRFCKFLVRTNIHVPENSDLSYCLAKEFHPPIIDINSRYSSLIEISSDENDDFLGRMNSKHRYYVKKSLKEKIDWSFGSQESLQRDFFGIYQEMNRFKGQDKMAHPYEYIKNLCEAFGNDHVKFLIGYSEGKPITGCMILVYGSKAYYYLAATNNAGRKLSGAYAMVYQLYHFLQEMNIQELDFGGMAPANPDAAGVDHFKRGFGGTLLKYVGEWELASSRWLKYAFNLGIQWKKDSL